MVNCLGKIQRHINIVHILNKYKYFLAFEHQRKKTKHKVLILHKIRFMRLIFLNADKKLFFLSYENNNNNR